MVNIDDFIKRLQIILDYYGLSASAFADRIDVQRSSISHLLSGRNKPSLDFILKVVEIFPEVDLYWILNGNGTFPKLEQKIEEKKVTPPIQNNIKTENKEIINPTDLFSEIETAPNNPIYENKQESTSFIENISTTDEPIDYIVIFFKDGTFKKYAPKK
ncbi:DNA-binding protein [Flavobacterium sp. 9AF]|uniref:helix-turn-helix transcriptional regulator n=1 Tax=Flavobacterium sp. 9AF TaxID=2653142 RepID=UPI0012F0BA2B|nr:helix-turn-helix transcriptional regulator [Flavobacterium sp. 9AF]VXA99704.1 DNA-binding protein [Flavobacterium sp. 9AF]